MDEFNREAGRNARDAALDLVASNAAPWFKQAMEFIVGMKQWRGTGEDLRVIVSANVGLPHHANAWGALTSQAVRRGHLRRTGEREAMRSVRSHARQTDVYVRTDAAN